MHGPLWTPADSFKCDIWHLGCLQIRCRQVDQSANRPVRELNSPRLDRPRVCLSANCPVTVIPNVHTFNWEKDAIPQTLADEQSEFGNSAVTIFPRFPSSQLFRQIGNNGVQSLRSLVTSVLSHFGPFSKDRRDHKLQFGPSDEATEDKIKLWKTSAGKNS